ncbi:hypothetical protein ACFLYO_00360 [Chloroflexota bacterium]
MVPGTATGEQTERLITALIDSVDRNTALLVGAIERWQPPIVTAREVVREVRVEPPPVPPEKSWELAWEVNSQPLPKQLDQPIVPIAAPSKTELALQWLRLHPKQADKSGRWLETNARPSHVKISYKTWNKVKRMVQQGEE